MPLGTYNSMTMLFERTFVPIGALYKYSGTIWTVHISMVRDRFFVVGNRPHGLGRLAGRPASRI